MTSQGTTIAKVYNMTTVKWTEIPTTSYEYITVEESIRHNAQRHLERAIAYASAGYPDRYYEGSMKKALKQFAKADSFKILDPFADAILKPIMDRLTQDMSDAILYGSHKVRI